MEKKTVWLVQRETGHELYDSEEKARKRYLEILTKLRNHKPNKYNYWAYKEYMSVDEDEMHYAIFDAKFIDEQKTFYIYYEKLQVN
jgi:hypothetical protein